MDTLYKGPALTAEVLEKRIREFNWELHAVAQWREPNPKARWHVLVKDNICVDGLRATAGSMAFKALKNDKEAFCVQKMRSKGIHPFGKTTMSELAGFLSTTMPMGYSELGAQGINPIDPDLTPGGSSSGSSISVAAGFCDAAVSTETHGSIVIPAMACGVVGMKPTVGLISRTGVVPISHSLDTPGATARTVNEAARLLSLLAGPDVDDPYTDHCPADLDLTTDLGLSKTPIRVALLVPQEGFDPEQKAALENLIARCKTVNIKIVEAPLKTVETHYKRISSTEIQGDMDKFLAQWGNGQTPSSFKELVQFYRMRDQHHPYGINRLEGALEYDPDLTNSDYLSALKEGTENCRLAIKDTLYTATADAIIAVGFVPWWAVGQAPYIALPIGQRQNKEMIGITVGARQWEDRKVLDIAARIEAVLNRD